MKKLVPTLKPRNAAAVALSLHKGGSHGKSRKAQRRLEKVSLQRDAY
jgi:hypothetical protein